MLARGIILVVVERIVDRRSWFDLSLAVELEDVADVEARGALRIFVDPVRVKVDLIRETQ